jgi:hypothetical protein
MNYAVVPAVRPIEYILTRVEKAVKLLPAQMAEEARQEAVRIMDSSRPRDNWTGAERKALRALQTTKEQAICRQTRTILQRYSNLWTTIRNWCPLPGPS